MVFPYKRSQVKPWLKSFFEKRFLNFGKFQDAIDPKYPFLFHSCISPLLNTGLLTPGDLLKEMSAYTNDNNIPINSEEVLLGKLLAGASL